MGCAAPATAAPQAPQKRAPGRNSFPHAVQNLCAIPPVPSRPAPQQRLNVPDRFPSVKVNWFWLTLCSVIVSDGCTPSE